MIYSTRFLIAVISILALMQMPAHAAKEPLRLKPTSKWVVNYADDSCRLGRQFGEGKETVLLFLDRFAPTSSFKITLAGRPMKLKSQPKKVLLQFGPKQAERKTSFFVGSLGKDKSGRKRPALIMKGEIKLAPGADGEEAAGPEESEGQLAAAITYLRVGSPLRQHAILETGPMNKPLVALNKCIDELMTHWGIDVEKHAGLTRKAEPSNSMAKWVVSSDYPKKLLWRGNQGTVNFRLSVDATGTPTACHIQLSTRPREFDETVCGKIMKRAKFTPALDVNGEQMASYYRGSVTFQIRR